MPIEDRNANAPSAEGTPSEQHPLDRLAKEIASGTISRRRALRLAGGALLGGLLASIPGAGFAQSIATTDDASFAMAGGTSAVAQEEDEEGGDPNEILRGECIQICEVATEGCLIGCGVDPENLPEPDPFVTPCEDLCFQDRATCVNGCFDVFPFAPAARPKPRAWTKD